MVSLKFRGLVAALAVVLFTPSGQVQAYPDKPIRLVVGFPPGGSTDLAARALAEKLRVSFDQAVIVENRPGASGNIAAELVARADPDGYTLLLAASSFAAAPAFFQKLSWNPVTDFSPVALVATVPNIVVVHPSVPATTPSELADWSRANPGKINLASPGATTLTGLAGEMFKETAGLDWATVHYRGGAPAVVDLLGGMVEVMFANISDVFQHVKLGRLNALAVTTPARSAVVPDVPTLAESGYPDFAFATWQAVVGPAGMSEEIVERLNAEIVKHMSTEELQQRFLSFGTDAATSTPAELEQLLVEEAIKIARIARKVGITPK
ncbi:MAG: tripartite tricarboxylate transporter substrate binding protein [Burkholderiaceae bacterium]